MLWLSPDVQYAHYVKEDDQKNDQRYHSEHDSEHESAHDSEYDSEYERTSLASLSLNDGAHKSLYYKEARWNEIFNLRWSVLIYNLSSRSSTNLYYSP